MNATTTNDVLNALRMLSSKTDSSYTPSLKDQSAPSVLSDEQETTVPTQEKRVGISILVGISYKNAQGNFKDRDFLIRRVVHAKNDLYIDGMAMDIRAPRLVKVSDISQIRDIGTGRIYDNAHKFLQDKLGIEVPDTVLPEKLPEFAKVIERMHNEIAVLMYVVALDGIREKVERGAVAKYVRSRTPDLTYTEQELDDYLISVAPDSTSAGMAFQRILLKDKEEIQAFVSALINVIMADGKAEEKERIFLAKVIDLLESRGFKFNLGA
ncbi:MAG: TerB family tellurite resistance protein [Alphaproteobacteria bacterium]|nr:TerB family tellurite resistance protein [Alphaproteobacteria bacterium]